MTLRDNVQPELLVRTRLQGEFKKSIDQLKRLYREQKLREDSLLTEPRSKAIEMVISGAVPHGRASVVANEWGVEANESVTLLSLSPRSSADTTRPRVLFLVANSDRNVCDPGCWCAGQATLTVAVVIPGAAGTPGTSSVMLHMHWGTANNSYPARVASGSASECQALATALALPIGLVGTVVASVVQISRSVGEWVDIEGAAAGRRHGDDEGDEEGEEVQQTDGSSSDFAGTFPHADKVEVSGRPMSINKENGSPRHLLSELSVLCVATPACTTAVELESATADWFDQVKTGVAAKEHREPEEWERPGASDPEMSFTPWKFSSYGGSGSRGGEAGGCCVS